MRIGGGIGRGEGVSRGVEGRELGDGGGVIHLRIQLTACPSLRMMTEMAMGIVRYTQHSIAMRVLGILWKRGMITT